MTKVLIRSCQRDNFLSRLCYETWRATDIGAEYVFLLEEGLHPFLSGLPAIIRPYADNFGGQAGVIGLVNAFKLLPEASGDDNIIVCDSDVVVNHNPLKQLPPDYGHAGFGNPNVFFGHISGQVQILRGNLFNAARALNEQDIKWKVEEMLRAKIDVADDTFMSFLSYGHQMKKCFINGEAHGTPSWYHIKMRMLERVVQFAK